MDDDRYTGPEIAEMMGSPAILTDLPDGTVQVEKAGITATGATPAEAVAEWGRKFAALVAKPKS
jgi:hypothetical protein